MPFLNVYNEQSHLWYAKSAVTCTAWIQMLHQEEEQR